MPLELPQRDQQDDAAQIQLETQAESQTSTVAAPSDLETPAMSEAPSEADSTHPNAPSSTLPAPSAPQPQSQPQPPAHKRTTTKPAVPLIPITPVIPNVPSSQQKPRSESVSAPPEKGRSEEQAKPAAADVSQPSEADAAPASPTTKVASPPPKAAPKSWADLVRTKSATATAASSSALVNGIAPGNVLGASKAGSLTEVLRSFTVDAEGRFSFLEPRGLVNTGNMCYMNSVSLTVPQLEAARTNSNFRSYKF